MAWEPAVKDRLSYFVLNPGEAKANVAVAFLWTMRDVILPKLDRKNLALACNFYTPAGIESMVRNVLANPYIRYIILLGEEYSSRKGDPTELTSANAMRTFFSKGITSERKLAGFENAVYFDKNIPTDVITKVRNYVELIDLNATMKDASFVDKIREANRLMAVLEKKDAFADPQTFAEEKPSGIMPFAGGPWLVRGSTIPKTWIEIMHSIYRYGRENLMDANTDRKVKEINNLVAVIHDPQNLDLSVNPFLITLTPEKIRAYQHEILSPELPEGKAYTYGNKLRAYLFPAPEKIKELLTTKEFKDFEFGQGKHLDENVVYKEGVAEINQIKDMIYALARNIYSKSVLAITWHPADELTRKHKSSPCLVLVQAMVQDEKLNLTTYWRSHDMVQGWPENAYGMAAIQKEIADAVHMPCGILTMISSSAQIYKTYYNQVEQMLEKYRKYEIDYHDPQGNFIINIKDGKIHVSHTDPVTNRELEAFEGKTSKEIYLKMAAAIGALDLGHAFYLGTELKKAEIALRDPSLRYVQDQELKKT